MQVKKPKLNYNRVLQQSKRQPSQYLGFANRVVEIKRGVSEIETDKEELPEVYKENQQKKSRNNKS